MRLKDLAERRGRDQGDVIIRAAILLTGNVDIREDVGTYP